MSTQTSVQKFESLILPSIVVAGIVCLSLKYLDNYLLHKETLSKQFTIDGVVRVDKNPREEARLKCLRDSACKKMAEAVYFEARGESPKGMVAVAQVIKNRVAEKQTTVQKVVDKPRQFSYTHQLKDKTIRDIETYKNVLIISQRVLTGMEKDVTLGANHYYAPKKVKRTPIWSKKMHRTVAIGNHIFFRG